MWTTGKITPFLLLLAIVVVLGKRKTPSRNKPKQKPKPKPKPKPVVKSYNVSSLEEGPGSCPGKYLFEEGDTLQLTSPGYPKRYPNNHNCQWGLEASGCQFNVVCDDLFTRPVCSGPTWRPLTQCEGDYLRFYSDPMPVEDSEGEETRFDQRFCWTQQVNFTFGFSDNLYVQFKTDRRWRARGFNCTVTCEAFDFSELFARIPLTHQNTVEEDYAEDYDDEDYDEDEDDNEEYNNDESF
eukprot:TRINITY_DN55000_c0_g1_i1.p1 TRINITY_DN55000_c0_g1~~TRINITY_DN55000_c0_g1_i1.p1  ORF type:complete len:248 (+),score=72.63 TRINITY_DN55000_c0_g1_i1:28-744(+)